MLFTLLGRYLKPYLGAIATVVALQLMAVGADTTADGQPQVARRQDLREGRAMVPLVLADTAANFERVAEAFGGQQADLGTFLLQNGIGGDRRAVHEQRAIA